MDKCPHCGGDSGYTYSSIQKFVVAGSWGGDEDSEYEQVIRETKPRCDDCGKIVKPKS